MNNFPSEIRAYQPLFLCGRGAYGTVWLVRDVVGRRYALKVVSKFSFNGEWEREFRGLKHYQNQVAEHPNLIRIFHIEECSDFFYYTMECADTLLPEKCYEPATLAGLLEKSGALPPAELRNLFDQLLDGLQQLHDAGLIHRDIKPDNIVFVNGVPKLGDIGLVSTVTHSLSLAGTQEFIPPEYLTGQRKLLTPEIDLYALGKCLYCAFSGEEANHYPLVSAGILRQPENRLFNALARRACAVEPFARLKTIREFRAVLHGDIGWGYEFRRVLLWMFLLLSLPFRLLFLLIRFILAHRWALVVLLLLGVGWIGMFLKTFHQLELRLHPGDYGFHADTLKRAFSSWHVPFSGCDLYDFYRKTALSVEQYGEKRLVTKEEYLRAKNPGIPSENLELELEIGDPGEGGRREKREIRYAKPGVTQTTPLQGEYLHEPVFRGLHSPKLTVPAGSAWQDGLLHLPGGKEFKVRYSDELPLRYEINLLFNPVRFRGSMVFCLTAAEYIPAEGKAFPEIPIRRQLRFRMHSTGDRLRFEPALYREQAASEEDLVTVGEPEIGEIELQDRFYEWKIIQADHCRRVYLDGNLILVTGTAFYGGFFEMRYRGEPGGELRIREFSIYDTKLVQPGETRRTRLVLPQRRPLGMKEELLRKFKWLDAVFPREFLPLPRIADTAFYGATNAPGSTIRPEKLRLAAGKTLVIFHRNWTKPCRLKFSTVFHDKETRLILQPYAIFGEQADRFQMGVLNRTFSIQADAASPDSPQKIDCVLTCESGTMSLVGYSGAREVCNASFFIPEAGKFRWGVRCDVKTRLELYMTEPAAGSADAGTVKAD